MAVARIPNAKRWRKAGRVVGHPLLNEAYPQIVELIRRSRQATTLADHVGLQRDLARIGWETRRFHETIRDAKQRLLDEQKEALAKNDGDRVRQISQAIPELEYDHDANRRRWTAVRAIQDGIIWRLFRYDRLRIAILGQADSPVNWLSASFPGECAAAEEHWEAGRLAVFCDLATCVNTGDLLVFSPADGRIQVTEVKESATARDDTPQFENMRIKVEFLNQGYSEELARDAPVLAPGARPPIRTHLSVLCDAIRRAGSKGFALTRAGDDFLLRALDLRAVDPDRQAEAAAAMDAEERRLRSRLGRAWAGAATYDFNSLDRIERDDLAAVPSTAPYSIFPFDEETCAALLLGWVTYRALLNLDVLYATFDRKGWQRIERPPELTTETDGFLWLRRGTSVIRVPATLADQLMVELVTLAAFEACVGAGFAQLLNATPNQVHIAWAWSGEERVWR